MEFHPVIGTKRFLCKKREQYHKLAHAAHLGYFAAIMFSGPYHWMAGACLVLGVISWLFLGEVE